MKKLIISIIAVSIIISSWFVFDLSRYLPADLIFHIGIKYESEEVQKNIAYELKEKNIPFRINDKSFIEYRKKDDEIVSQIAERINLENAGYKPMPLEVDRALEKARNFLTSGNFDEALTFLNNALLMYPESADLYSLRGMIMIIKKEYDKAIEDYSKTIESAPNSPIGYLNRGLTWARKDDFNRAVEDYNKAIEIYPDDSTTLFSRGYALSKLGKIKDAIKDYNRSIEINPKEAKIYYRKIEPIDPIYLDILASYFAKSGEFKEAILSEERAIALLNKSGVQNLEKYRKRLECYKINRICDNN